MRQLTGKEHNLQKTIVYLLRSFGIFCFETDIMDGLKLCNSERMRLSFITHHKQMGYVNGQSDLILIIPNECIFVELKNGKSGRQSESQKEFQKIVESLGFEYEIWRSVEDCEIFVKKHKKR